MITFFTIVTWVRWVPIRASYAYLLMSLWVADITFNEIMSLNLHLPTGSRGFSFDFIFLAKFAIQLQRKIKSLYVMNVSVMRSYYLLKTKCLLKFYPQQQPKYGLQAMTLRNKAYWLRCKVPRVKEETRDETTYHVTCSMWTVTYRWRKRIFGKNSACSLENAMLYAERIQPLLDKTVKNKSLFTLARRQSKCRH